MTFPATIAQPVIEFRTAYWQLEPIERRFVDGFVSDLEKVAERTKQRLAAVLMQPVTGLDDRAMAFLARPLIRSAIAERVREISDLCDVSTYRSLKEVTAIAYSNIKNYVQIDQWGEPVLNLSEATVEQLSAVKSFEWIDMPKGGRRIKFTLHDKMQGLTQLMRYQGLLNESNEHWRDTQAKEKPARERTAMPANIDDEQAAELYSRTINGG